METILNPADVAEKLSELHADERLLEFLKVPKEYKADVFAHLTPVFRKRPYAVSAAMMLPTFLMP